MKSRRRTPWIVAAVLVALVAGGWAALERRFTYRFPGFPPARSPCLRLEIAERLGYRTFHSQFGQDKWILGAMFAGVDDGYFVDIGAGDAVILSNTKALEDAGWSGVCVEPFPVGDWSRRRAKLFEEVVYATAGEEVEFRMAGSHGGIDPHIDRWKDDVEAAGVVRLKTTTIGDVLARADAPRYIHYLSLDVEGAEFEVLLGFPFDDYRVGAMTIEHNGEEAKRRRVRDLLEANGYRFIREHVVEDWYAGPRSK